MDLKKLLKVFKVIYTSRNIWRFNQPQWDSTQAPIFSLWGRYSRNNFKDTRNRRYRNGFVFHIEDDSDLMNG